jgi:two-component system chemotaxis response regulator CheB
MIRVFVVDDSSFTRKAVARVLNAHPDCRVVGEASDGQQALERIAKADPDVVTLDVEMRGMDGLATLRALLAWRPGLRVIMLSAHTRKGAEATLEALSEGAVDFIDKAALSLMDLEGLSRELVERVRACKSSGGSVLSRSPAPLSPPPTLDLATVDLCVIGASTGGPAAIQYILERLPADFPFPTAIVQHMPVGFTRPFADRLDALCRLEVAEAAEGDRLTPGRILIAPAGRHLRIGNNLRVMLANDSQGARHVPSVDVLMKSADRARRGRVLALLLTGMGEDGAEGMSIVRAHGGITIGESEASCAVFGMPRAALLRGAVDCLLSLEEIAGVLARAGDPAQGART